MPELSVRSTPTLDSTERAAVLELVAAAAQADGVRPLNEAAGFALAGQAATHWLVAGDARLIGYAQLDPATRTAQLVVAPGHRRRGVATELIRAVGAEAPSVSWWAFGNLPPAAALADKLGFAPDRILLILGRDLFDAAAPTAPAGVEIKSFRPGDEAALLEVNAAAFAHHPEQGGMDLEDLRTRMAEPWFAAADLLLAWETATGRLLGFHWTKRHDAALGEVYVLAVAPDAAGAGLGRTLLKAGLRHLSQAGVRRVILYVEGDNERAVGLYLAAGFAVEHTDVCYSVRGHEEPGR